MVSLSPALRTVVRPGILAFESIRVVEREDALDAPVAEAEQAVRSAPAPETADVRAMYRAVGIDPTRRRPSSEALLRRVMRGDPLPRINSLVDVCNWCSLEYQLPYGLYDLDRISGPIELRLGREAEQYAGIRKDEVHVAGRLTLADGLGPFGNPSSDSERTMVLPGTTRALVVVYAPFRASSERVSAVLEVTSRRIAQFTGGRELVRRVV